MPTIKVPLDTKDFKAKFKAALSKSKEQPIKDPTAKAKADKEAAARIRAKELKQELESATLTAAEKDAKIAELEAQIAELNAKYNEAKPLADDYKNYERVERAKILDKIPTEMRKEAKDLPLGALRTFAKAFTGSGGEVQKQKSEGKPLTMEEAEAAGPDAFNKWMDDELKKTTT